jgi:TetR/AcrR family transcriptional repressor of nem operon
MALNPTTARGQATRDRILRAAVKLAAEHGVAGTAVDDICAQAHVSKSQMYHYFEDRDDLIKIIVEATSDDVMALQAGLLAQFDSLSGIQRYLDALVTVQRKRQARGGCPIGSLAGQLAEVDDQARLAIDDGFRRWHAGLRTGLTSMLDRGELTPSTDPDKLATQTLALLQGGLLLTQVRRDPGQLRTAADAILTLIHAHLI